MIGKPEDIQRLFECKADGLSQIDLFNKPEYSWLLDIWIAGEFGHLFNTHIEACDIEVDDQDSQNYYDFKLHLENCVVPFQAAESLESERRRGLEYKEDNSLFHQPYWRESDTEPYEYICRTIDKKYKKYRRGAADINLVIYANLFGFDIDRRVLLSYCNDSASHFKSVWLFSSLIFGALYESDSSYYERNDWIHLQS